MSTGDIGTRRWVYPTLVGIVIGALLAGLTFRMAAKDPLTASAGGGYGMGTTANASGGGDGSTTPTDQLDTTSGSGPTTGAGGSGATTGAGGGPVSNGQGGPSAATSSAGQAALTASDVGVTATTIRVGVALLDLGGASALGAAVPGFDPAEQQKQWETFFGDLNRSGGILGRKIEASYVKSNPLDTNSVRAACLYFTQEKRVFLVFSGAAMANGDGDLCVAVENRTLDISGSVLPTEQFQRAQGLLIASTAHGNRFFADWARALQHLNRLRGRKLGLLLDQGNAEAMARNGMVATFKSMGITPTYIATVSSDPAQGPSQVPPHVQQMRAAGVDTVIFGSSFINATAFVNQADKQLWKPQYLVSDFLGMDIGTLLNGMPDSFEGALAVTYYDKKHPEKPWETSCRTRWNSASGSNLSADPKGSDAQVLANVFSICRNVDLLTSAAKSAGPMLTRRGFSAALQQLTTFDWGGLGGSFGPGKTDYADYVRTMVWAKPNGSSSNCNSNQTYCFNDADPPFNPSRV